MKQAILAAILAITLGVTSSFPVSEVKLIKSPNKRDITFVSEQDLTTTTSSGPCDLPVHEGEFAKYIFSYNKGANLDAIKETVEEFTESGAQVKSVKILQFVGIIIFEMNRAAYLQACTNSEIKAVEYDQNVTVASPSHCNLTVHEKEFPKYIFVYNKGADLDAIKKTVEGYNESGAEVKSVEIQENLGIIFFEINRAAYLQACTDPEIKSVEYDEPVVGKGKTDTDTDPCKQVDSFENTRYPYTVVLSKPDTVKRREVRCRNLVSKLENRKTKTNDSFWVFTNSNSCNTNGTEVTLAARLNVGALKYICGLKGIEKVSVVLPEPGVIVG